MSDTDKFGGGLIDVADRIAFGSERAARLLHDMAAAGVVPSATVASRAVKTTNGPRRRFSRVPPSEASETARCVSRIALLVGMTPIRTRGLRNTESLIAVSSWSPSGSLWTNTSTACGPSETIEEQRMR